MGKYGESVARQRQVGVGGNTVWSRTPSELGDKIVRSAGKRRDAQIAHHVYLNGQLGEWEPRQPQWQHCGELWLTHGVDSEEVEVVDDESLVDDATGVVEAACECIVVVIRGPLKAGCDVSRG